MKTSSKFNGCFCFFSCYKKNATNKKLIKEIKKLAKDNCYDECINQCKNCIKLNIDSWEPYYYLAFCYYKKALSSEDSEYPVFLYLALSALGLLSRKDFEKSLPQKLFDLIGIQIENYIKINKGFKSNDRKKKFFDAINELILINFSNNNSPKSYLKLIDTLILMDKKEKALLWAKNGFDLPCKEIDIENFQSELNNRIEQLEKKIDEVNDLKKKFYDAIMDPIFVNFSKYNSPQSYLEIIDTLILMDEKEKALLLAKIGFDLPGKKFARNNEDFKSELNDRIEQLDEVFSEEEPNSSNSTKAYVRQ